MRNLRLRFDRQLTKVVAELANRHGMTRANVVLAAISMYKAISDLDSLQDESQPGLRFSERIQTIARQESNRTISAAPASARAAGAGA